MTLSKSNLTLFFGQYGEKQEQTPDQQHESVKINMNPTKFGHRRFLPISDTFTWNMTAKHIHIENGMYKNTHRHIKSSRTHPYTFSHFSITRAYLEQNLLNTHYSHELPLKKWQTKPVDEMQNTRDEPNRGAIVDFNYKFLKCVAQPVGGLLPGRLTLSNVLVWDSFIYLFIFIFLGDQLHCLFSTAATFWGSFM